MRPDPDPMNLSDAALRCAYNACAGSTWISDQQFAEACKREMERRQQLEKASPPTPRALFQVAA